MTLDEVKREFDIDCVPNDYEGTAWHARTPSSGQPTHSLNGMGTESDVVCALLKAQYGIITHHLSAASQGIDPAEAGDWQAWHKGQGIQAKAELAAVVALARRMEATP